MEQRDLNDLAVFSAIAQAGSITGAAKILKLPKSNVSRRLARLESRLGAQLIERNTRSSRLTSIGVRYADFCSSMVEEANAADAVVETSRAEPYGELRVSASRLVGQQIIAPAIAAYIQQFPKVQVFLELTNARINLIEDGFDLAFRIGENSDSTMMSQTLSEFRFGLYASPEYLENSGNPHSPGELNSHRCLHISGALRAGGWKLSRDNEVVKIKAPGAVVVNDFMSLRNLAMAGGGIAMLPAYAVHAECATGRLSPILSDWDASSVTLSAVYPSRRGATLKQRALIDHVKDVASKLP